MIVDGKKIANDILVSIIEKLQGKKLQFAVITAAPDAVTQKYLRQKEKIADMLGASTQVHTYDEDVSLETLLGAVRSLSDDEDIAGIVVQLPLPEHIEANKITSQIPPSKDMDALGLQPIVLSPVARAVQEILSVYKIETAGKKVAVVGKGKLVGEPVARMLDKEGVTVVRLDEHSNLHTELLDADVVVTGVGVPGLIAPEMIRSGCVIIDAGTSESNGKLIGDVSTACAEKASVFSPVPGGVGPVAVTMLFANLVDLYMVAHKK